MPYSLVAATLYSSSSGNSVYIKNGDEEFLIDVGVSAKCIEKSLSGFGTSLKNINGIFITHEHSDHIKGLETICKYHNIPVYAPASCAEMIKCDCPSTEKYIKPLNNSGDEVKFKKTVFTSFHTPHDSVDSCGYVVNTGNEKIGLATDMGFITKITASALSGCRYVIIESNHDVTMLKNGAYPYSLKQRILSNHGHLSNTDCAAFLPYLVSQGTVSFLLAHLSDHNNTPDIAFSECFNKLCETGISVCTKETVGDVSLAVAKKDSSSILVCK